MSGEQVKLCLEYRAKKHSGFENVYLSFTISEIAGEADVVLRLSSFDDKVPLQIFTKDSQNIEEGELQVHMPYLGLSPGAYVLKIFVKKDSLYTLDFVESFRFTVDSKTNMSKCLFYQPRVWTLKTKTLNTIKNY
jgi:lipopolysaccharide transport system ATP-binding protein